MQMTLSRSVSSGACTTRPMFDVTRLSASLDVETESGRSSVCRSTVPPEYPFDVVEDLRSDPFLGRAPHVSLALVGEDHHFVLARLEANVRIAHVVVDEEIDLLAGPLRPCAS